jgi:hypothetical protein
LLDRAGRHRATQGCDRRNQREEIRIREHVLLLG